MTKCRERAGEFEGVAGRPVMARFGVGRISSDGGALVLAETERRTGIRARFAACFADHRDRRGVEHSVADLARRRVLGLGLGDEDRSDHGLVVIDEPGYPPISEHAADLLFRSLGRRHERVSVIVNRNMRFAEWGKLFPTERLLVALHDRIGHRAHILEMNGESFRPRDAKQRKSASRAELRSGQRGSVLGAPDLPDVPNRGSLFSVPQGSAFCSPLADAA